MTTTINDKAPSSASRDLCTMQRFDWRRRSRGVYFRDHVLAFVVGLADKSRCSLSCAVNLLLEQVISKGSSQVEEKLALDVRRHQLLAEEAALRQTMKVLLRSGAYLPQYAQKLFEGKDPKDLAYRKGRLPLSALASVKEQEIIKRILARREQIVLELIQVADKLLPKEQFPVGLEETGWTVRSNRPRGTRTGQSTQKTGGEKPK